MEEEKKTFKEKWEDKKYQAKVKLSGYGIFIGVIILILLLGGGNTPSDNDTNVDNDTNNSLNSNTNNNIDNEVTFTKPNSDNYTYEIEIITKKDNIEDKYYYYGEVNNDTIELVKEVGNKKYNYKITNNKYYVLNNNNYILTTKEDVYDILDYSYLDTYNINNYLSYSKLVNNKYQVYLKDIILDNNSDDYITIELEENNLNIDYTNLINKLNNEYYDKFLVNMKYNEE